MLNTNYWHLLATCWSLKQFSNLKFTNFFSFFSLSKGFKLSIPQVALTVEGLAQFMNGLYVVLDVLSQLHYTSWRVLSVIATSPSFAVTILVIFYFRDLTAQTGMKAGVSFIQSKYFQPLSSCFFLTSSWLLVCVSTA